MSYIVTVTFDLEDHQPSSEYEKIRAGLASYGIRDSFPDQITGAIAQLPRNTYVGIFNWSDAAGLRAYVSNIISHLFNVNNLSGPYFVSVGTEWAMMKGRVDQSPLLRALTNMTSIR